MIELNDASNRASRAKILAARATGFALGLALGSACTLIAVLVWIKIHVE